MKPIVEIDSYAGFCSGVSIAVRKAEADLETSCHLHCLGEFIHNEAENKRLAARGMITISKPEYEEMRDSKVLIRSHGEPPETYAKAKERNIILIDATCPIVKNLQKKIRKTWKESRYNDTQVVIAGKKGHPEIIGLQGQVQKTAIIIQSKDDIVSVNPLKPVELFAQTTFSQELYTSIINQISEKMEAHGNLENLRVHYTICRQVSNRIPQLIDFSKRYDVVLFVAGKNSSNGKALFDACLKANPQSYHITTGREVKTEWICGKKKIGISGATSTPGWLIEEVRNTIIEMCNES